jgi:HEAT repeat protein
MAATKRRTKRSPDRELETLEQALTGSDPQATFAALAAALESAQALVVKRAAEAVRTRGLAELAPGLGAAFSRFLVDPVQSDPGCHAKLAVLEALDFLESHEEGPFLLGARHIQLEPSWGPPIDTAVGVRARSIVALARLGYADLGLHAAELLNDKESPVRQAAAEALGHRGAREGAALLVYKLRLGDADPMVMLAVMNALLALAHDWALPVLAAQLQGSDAGARELAAIALGQSRRAEALSLLVAELERCVRAQEREPLWRALGLHRSEGALARLLEGVAHGGAADARAALTALAVRRFEPGIPERARKAAAQNEKVDLRKELEALDD